jgi:hypothetical protein
LREEYSFPPTTQGADHQSLVDVFFLITFSFHAHIIETPNSKQIGSIAPKKEDNNKKNEQFPYLFFSKKKERGFDFYLFKR